MSEDSFSTTTTITSYDLSPFVNVSPTLTEEDKSQIERCGNGFLTVKMIYASIYGSKSPSDSFSLPFLQVLLVRETTSTPPAKEQDILTLPSLDFCISDAFHFEFPKLVDEVYQELQKFNLLQNHFPKYSDVHHRHHEDAAEEHEDSIEYLGYLLELPSSSSSSCPILYIFSKCTPESEEAKELSSMYNYVWDATLYEILYSQHVCEFPIDLSVSQFFLSHMWAGLLEQEVDDDDHDKSEEKEKEQEKEEEAKDKDSECDGKNKRKEKKKKQLLNMVAVGYFGCDVQALKFHAMFGQTKAETDQEYEIENFDFAIQSYVASLKSKTPSQSRPPRSLRSQLASQPIQCGLVRCALDLRQSEKISHFFLPQLIKEEKNIMNVEILRQLEHARQNEHVQVIELQDKTKIRYLLKSQHLSKPLSYHIINNYRSLVNEVN